MIRARRLQDGIFGIGGGMALLGALFIGCTTTQQGPDGGVQVSPNPDIELTEFSVTPSVPTQGSPVIAHVVVTNRGRTPSAPFSVEWWAGENFPAPEKVWQVEALPLGGSQVLTHTNEGYASGYSELTTKVVADPSNAVAETNERNNVRKMQIRVARAGSVAVPTEESDVTAAPPLRSETAPDIYVSEFALTPSSPIQGSPVKVRIGVYNKGTVSSGPFSVEWWPGENFKVPATVWRVDSTQARGSKILEYTYAGYRSHYPQLTTRVVVDSRKEVSESDEANNERKKQIHVRRQSP